MNFLDRLAIHREGWRFIAAFAVASLLLGWLWSPLGVLGALLTAWCAYFFRDPPRQIPIRADLVLAPADGIVQSIQPAVPPLEIGLDQRPRIRVSIFMSVFDVHINRAPVDAAVIAAAYRPGTFLNAALDKASDENERQSLHLRSEDGHDFCVVQIAGLIARRILCEAKPGDRLRAGARFGLIRFGSRVDLYLPDGIAPLVAIGQRMVGGETVIADLRSEEPARLAEER